MKPADNFIFHKMHGAGNDFILLDLRTRGLDISPERARYLADRRRGAGCDQLLILRAAVTPGSVTSYQIRNADGSAAGQCGNGARCIGLYLLRQGEVGDQPFQLDSPAGPIRMQRCADGEFAVDLGEPDFLARNIPLKLDASDGCYRLDSP